MVFVDMGRAMPDGSPALLKTRRHLHRDQAEKFWKELVRTGVDQVSPPPPSGDLLLNPDQSASLTYGSFIHSVLVPPLGALDLPVRRAPVARLAS